MIMERRGANKLQALVPGSEGCGGVIPKQANFPDSFWSLPQKGQGLYKRHLKNVHFVSGPDHFKGVPQGKFPRLGVSKVDKYGYTAP